MPRDLRHTVRTAMRIRARIETTGTFLLIALTLLATAPAGLRHQRGFGIDRDLPSE